MKKNFGKKGYSPGVMDAALHGLPVKWRQRKAVVALYLFLSAE